MILVIINFNRMGAGHHRDIGGVGRRRLIAPGIDNDLTIDKNTYTIVGGYIEAIGTRIQKLDTGPTR